MKTYRILLFLLLGTWGAIVGAAGALRLFAHVPPWLVPVLVAGLTVSFSLAISRWQPLRLAVESIPLRALIGSHLTRLLGIYFLWLYTQNRLPAEFAHRAGWGDVAAALGAGVLLVMREGPGFRRALFWWNLVGAADLLVAVGTGGWLNLTRPGSMNEVAAFPLALVPFWLVPVFLSSHLYLLRQPASGTARIEPHAPRVFQ